MTNGFYLMHRGWMNSAAVQDKFNKHSAWCWLIEHAAFKNINIDIKGKTVSLERGQLSYSLSYLCKAWGWKSMRVRWFLKRLKSDRAINIDNNTGQQIITICNYSIYQTSSADISTAKDTVGSTAATQQQHSSNNNKKEGKRKTINGKEVEGVTAPRTKGTRLPVDWVLPVALSEWAEGEGLLDIQRVADKFRDYWIAAPGQKGVKLDWPATWRNWVRREMEQQTPQTSTTESALDQLRKEFSNE